MTDTIKKLQEVREALYPFAIYAKTLGAMFSPDAIDDRHYRHCLACGEAIATLDAVIAEMMCKCIDEDSSANAKLTAESVALKEIVELGDRWANTPHDYTLRMRDIAKAALSQPAQPVMGEPSKGVTRTPDDAEATGAEGAATPSPATTSSTQEIGYDIPIRQLKSHPAMRGYCCGCRTETTNLNTHTCKPEAQPVNEAESFARLCATPMTNFNRMREADQLKSATKELSCIAEKMNPEAQHVDDTALNIAIELESSLFPLVKLHNPATGNFSWLRHDAVKAIEAAIISHLIQKHEALGQPSGCPYCDGACKVCGRELKREYERPTLTPAQREELVRDMTKAAASEDRRKPFSGKPMRAALAVAEKRLLGKV